MNEVSQEAVRKSVLQTIANLDDGVRSKINLSLGDDAVLYGRDGTLDSLELVSLIVAVEQDLTDSLGVEVSLADEKALSQKRSPFSTVGTLIEFICQEVKGEG